MGKVSKEILVKRPPEEVYEFLLNPENLKLMPGIVEARRKRNIFHVKGEEKIPLVGLQAVSYQICIDETKKPLFAKFHTEDFVSKTRISWHLDKVDNGTLVKYTTEYKLPGFFLGQAIDKLLMEKRLAKEVEEYLSNVQQDLEKIKEVMTKDLVCVDARVTIAEAGRKMEKEKVRYLLVVKNKKVVGVLTDGDIVSKVHTEGLVADECVVERVMSGDLITVDPEASVLKALNLMATHKIRRLPIVKDDKLVGIVSITDLKHYFEAFKEK